LARKHHGVNRSGSIPTRYLGLGSDTVEVEGLPSGVTIQVDALAKFPSCPSDSEQATPATALPCVPLPCLKEWAVVMSVDSIELDPYEPKNDVLSGNEPGAKERLAEDASDRDYFLHVTTRGPGAGSGSHLRCGA
jgi:hypothetical protein